MASPEPKDKERVEKKDKAERERERDREAKEKEKEKESKEVDLRIVKLNIGGYKYSTTRATLTSVPNSYFTALLDERMPTAKDEKGAYFIDRDGQYFPPILTYLRTKELHVLPEDRRAVLREAKFYLLGPVVHLLHGIGSHEEEIQHGRWHLHAQKYFETHEAKIDVCIQKLIAKGRTEAKVKITNVNDDGVPLAPPNADLIILPIKGAAAQTIEETKGYFFRRGFGVSRATSDDPEADLSVHFGPFPEAQENYVSISSSVLRP